MSHNREVTETLEKVVQENQELCPHDKCEVNFDSKAAKGLDEYEIRRRWPRFWGVCPDCGANLIKYASAEHFVAGDW